MINKEAIENAYQRYANVGSRPILHVGASGTELNELLVALDAMGFIWMGGSSLVGKLPIIGKQDDDFSLFLNSRRRVTYGSYKTGHGEHVDWLCDDQITEISSIDFMSAIAALYGFERSGSDGR